MKNKPKGKKTVRRKAWVIVTGKRVVAVEFGSKRPERFTIGTWVFYLADSNSKAIPCEITYSI